MGLTHGLGGGRSRKHKHGKKQPHEIRIRRGHKSGFIVEVHHRPDQDTGIAPEMEEHPLPDLNALHDHINQHLDGGQPPDEHDEEPEGGYERDGE